MSNNKLIVTGSFLPSSRNTPLDARTRINSIINVESIEVPFIGMIFYVEDKQKFYKVLSLKSKKVGPVELANSLIDKYEELINPDFITKDYIKGTIEDVNSLKTAIDLKSEKFTVGKGLNYSENKIDLVINTSENNALKIDESGLYVQTSEYSLDPVLNPESGFAAQYEFKKDGVVLNTINITEDQFLRDVTFHSSAENGVNIEAPYLKFTWNVQNGSNTSYVPVGELVDVYEPGDAIDIKNNKISVKVASNASNGISLLLDSEGKLSINTDIETLASAVIARHEIIPDTAETVVIVSEIGQYKVGTSIQSILEDLNSKITNSIHDIENGDGITVDSTNINKPKISVNVNPESALIVEQSGLDITWTEIS